MQMNKFEQIHKYVHVFMQMNESDGEGSCHSSKDWFIICNMKKARVGPRWKIFQNLSQSEGGF